MPTQTVSDATAKNINESASNSVAAPDVPYFEGDEHPTDGTGIIKIDPGLGKFKEELRQRFNTTQNWIKKFNEHEGGLDGFSKVRH